MTPLSVPHALARASAATASIKRETVYGLDPSGRRPSLLLQRSKLKELRAAVTSTEAATSGRAEQGQLSAWTCIAQERWEGELIVEGDIPLWLVASVEVPPFMTCHFINAYEEVDEEGRVTSIIADCCEHNADPTTILERLKLHSLRSFAGQDILPDARVGRFRIPLNGKPIGELQSALDPEEHGRGMDMCNINPAYLGRPYQYAYACGARRPCNFPNTLTKMDLVEKTARNWHEEGSVPSEPYFVARPGATKEDDGVVISIVSCKSGEGYALILDGSSFEEIARAKLPYGLPYGFHGCWVPKK